MQIALIALEGFNEIDTFVAFTLLNRIHRDDWEVAIAGPSPQVTSMNGVTIQVQKPLGYARSADAVLFGSGRHTLEQSQDQDLLVHLHFDSKRQLIGSQCSGALMLQALGLIDGLPVCTDDKTREIFAAQGTRVLDQAFVAYGNRAMAGGCLAAQYLATWVIRHFLGEPAARQALEQTAPVSQIEEYVNRAIETVVSGSLDG